MVAKKDRLDETEGEESKDLDRSQKAIPGNLSDNSISSRVEPRPEKLVYRPDNGIPPGAPTVLVFLRRC